MQLDNGEVMYEHMKILVNFYADNYLQNIDAYQYLLKELQEEKVKVTSIAIQTPLVGMSLNQGNEG
jgi:hypothetical protein